MIILLHLNITGKTFRKGRVYRHKLQKEWTKDIVSYIFKNEIYTGDFNNHKKKTVNIKERAIKLSNEEHFTFENNYESIISKEIFNLQKRFKHIQSCVLSHPLPKGAGTIR